MRFVCSSIAAEIAANAAATLKSFREGRSQYGSIEDLKNIDRICDEMKTLTEPAQLQVLEFVALLKLRLREEDTDWSNLSLATAMRDMQGDVWPEYSEALRAADLFFSLPEAEQSLKYSLYHYHRLR